MTYLEKEKIEQFYQYINQYETIIIHRHVRPDPDAIGSQLGLKQLLCRQFPNKRILAAGTTTQGLNWLGDMDNISEDNYQNALVIICDTANQERIDGKHYLKGDKIIKIDHHPENDIYGDLSLVYPNASSTSEIICLISKFLDDKLIMNKKAAELLYAGINGDTGRFMFSSTSSITFEMVAWLMTYNFDFYNINDKFTVISEKQAKFQGHIYDHLQFTGHGVAYVIIRKEDRLKYDISEEETNSIVQLPGSIKGIYSWAIFVEQDGNEDFWRVRIRSKGPIINGVAQLHNGGGHPLASGANAYSIDDINMIIKELDEVVIDYNEKNLNKKSLD